MNYLRRIHASAHAATATVIVVVVVTVLADLWIPFKTWLAGFTGHHWETKSWLSVIVFAVVFALVHWRRPEPDAVSAQRALRLLLVTTLVGFAVILAFYAYLFTRHS